MRYPGKTHKKSARNCNTTGTVIDYLRFTPGEGLSTLLIRQQEGNHGFLEIECVGLREDIDRVMQQFRKKKVDVIFTKDSFTVKLAPVPGVVEDDTRVIVKRSVTSKVVAEPDWVPPEPTASEELD